MNFSRIIFILTISFFNEFVIHAQEKLIEDYKFSVYFGVRDISRDSFQNTENIDFLNYLHSSPDMSEYQYLGFSSHIWFRGDWEADIKIAMYDDFAPNNFNIKAQYFPWKYIGFSAGFYIYPQLLNDFSTYHRVNDIGFYGDMNTNFRQRYVYENGIMAGVVLPFDYKFIHSRILLNGGVSSLSRFEEKVAQKKINSNLRTLIEYKTSKSPAFFFLPEIELYFDCFKFEKSIAGLQIQSSWYAVNRSVDYERTYYEWTNLNPLKEHIESVSHHFTKFELDFGFYLKW